MELIVNGTAGSAGEALAEMLVGCRSAVVVVAYVLRSGADELLHLLHVNGVDARRVTVVCGTDHGFTEPEALWALHYYRVDLRLYSGRGLFHPKVYYARGEKGDQLLVGSSNMSAGGVRGEPRGRDTHQATCWQPPEEAGCRVRAPNAG